MRNQISAGDDVNVLCPVGGMTAGLVYIFNNMFGVSANTNVSGDTAVIVTKGIFSLPKNSAEAWAVGDPIYWDAVNMWASNVVGTAPVLIQIGVATDPATNPSTLAAVRLNPSF